MARFLLDAMCGALAPYLRICGHDAAYAPDRGVEADDRLRALAAREERTLVTRDVALAGQAADAVLLSAPDVDDQLRELAGAGVALVPAETPTRCGRCNGRLVRVETAADTPEYAPDADETAVWRCRACDQHFWKGSHWDRVAATLAEC